MEKVDIVGSVQIVDLPNRALASHEITMQPDLLYMKSVLVSAGWNDNDDFFLPDELWRARLTPKLKPVDWEHNTGQELLDNALGALKDPKKIVQDNQIVGVMHNAYAADANGPIDDSGPDFAPPNKFNVINEAVIFKYLFPKTAARIVKDAQENKLFVSMEAWFKNYDYILGNKIVARNEHTAFLDSNLRVRGGNGKYGGERIGRVLRNITFGGVGLVSRPANKDSVIESFTNASQEEVKPMKDETKEAAAAAQIVEKLATAESALQAKEAELAAATKKIEEMLSIKASLDGAVEASAKSLLDAKAESAKFKADLDVALAKLAEIEEQKVYASRLALVTSELKLTANATDSTELKGKKVAKAEKLTKSVVKYSEEAFASWLAEIKDVLALSIAEMPPWMKEKDEDEDKKEKKEEKAECAKASEIIDPKVLDNVKAEAPIPAGKDNAGNVVKLSDKMKSLAAELLPAAKK